MGATNTRVAKVEDDTLAGILRRPTPDDRSEWPKHLLLMIDEVLGGEKAGFVVGGVAGVRGREAIVASLPEARVYNDALMAGLGEAVYGAGKDKEVVGYIGLGTGIGTARISGKKVDSAGFEAGHHILDISTNESWEEKISGRVLKERHQKYPQELDRKVYEDYIKMIAFGVYNSILFWSPEVIVMGGALINEKESFEVEEIARAVSNVNEALPALPPIVKSELGDNAGLYGAMAITPTLIS
ncbi:MAG: ROK family protein [bacterium]|nr:ROK family protein [bacterium]